MKKTTLSYQLRSFDIKVYLASRRIENFWHELKHNLRSNVKPRNKDELIKGIEDFWSTVTPEKCRKYIGHIQRVLPVVVERQGKASGF